MHGHSHGHGDSDEKADGWTKWGAVMNFVKDFSGNAFTWMGLLSLFRHGKEESTDSTDIAVGLALSVIPTLGTLVCHTLIDKQNQGGTTHHHAPLSEEQKLSCFQYFLLAGDGTGHVVETATIPNSVALTISKALSSSPPKLLNPIVMPMAFLWGAAASISPLRTCKAALEKSNGYHEPAKDPLVPHNHQAISADGFTNFTTFSEIISNWLNHSMLWYELILIVLSLATPSLNEESSPSLLNLIALIPALLIATAIAPAMSYCGRLLNEQAQADCPKELRSFEPTAEETFTKLPFLKRLAIALSGCGSVFEMMGVMNLTLRFLLESNDSDLTPAELGIINIGLLVLASTGSVSRARTSLNVVKRDHYYGELDYRTSLTLGTAATASRFAQTGTPEDRADDSDDHNDADTADTAGPGRGIA